MKTTIYFIRHAQSISNIGGKFMGRFDAPLAERGREQLIELAAHFGEIHLDAVYASPLIRAKETACAVGSAHGLTPILRPRLMEICGGIWENMTWEDIRKERAAEFALWRDEPHRFAVEGGESMREVYARMTAEMCFLAEQNEGKTIAVVSHGCAIRCFMCHAYGIGLEKMQTLPFFANAGVCKLGYEPGIGFSVEDEPTDICYRPDEKPSKSVRTG